MFDSYQKIFHHRAARYHAAMAAYPDVRRQEFEHAVRLLELRTDSSLCDVPAGGGYLSRYITAPSVRVISLETSHEFAAQCPTGAGSAALECALSSLPIADGSIDRLVSLAALHHVEDKQQQFGEFSRVLCRGGRLVVADVEAGSNVAAFLNEFVDRYNSMGHEGWFIGETCLEDMEAAGLVIQAVERPPVTWLFADSAGLAGFCQNLFGLDLASEEDVLSGIKDYFDLRQLPDQGLAIDWPLLYVAAHREAGH